MFKTIDGNRVLNRKYLSRLTESISNDNLLSCNPIIVNKNFEVLDGQHRLKVAEIMGIDIFYTVSPTGNIREVQMLNSNVRGWTMADFLNSHLKMNKKEYKILKEFSEKNGISVSSSIRILTGGFRKTYSETEALSDFRDGSFKVTQFEYGNEFAKKLQQVSKYLEDRIYTDRNFLIALQKTYDSGFLHQDLMTNFERVHTNIIRSSRVKDYIRQLEDVLSFGRKKVLRVMKGS